MRPILDKQAVKSRWKAFNNIRFCQHLGWLAGSTFAIVVASSSPAAAQRTLFSETFANPTVNNPGSFLNGISGQSLRPCLTAATPVATQPTQPTGVPPCSTTTTNANLLPDPAGAGTLRLTSNNANQAGFVLFNQPIFSGDGLIITFDFFAYSSSGNGADGISFFLIRGGANPQTAGAFGGSLGYAQRNDPNTVPGLVGGFVGIGFDEFGNYSNQSEGRVGGNSNPTLPDGRTPDSVAIRGSQGSNYRYLTGTSNGSVPPLQQSIDNPGATNRNQAGVRRTARITLTPDNQISVDVDFSGTGLFVNVIPRFNLSNIPGQGERPETVNFGFAASTGNQNNIHEIQNLSITTIPPDLSLTKQGPPSFTIGQPGSYTLRIQNSPSAGPTTGPITVVDNLPPGLDFVSATGTDWSCSAAGKIVTCNYGGVDLRPGGVAPPITLTVVPTPAAGGSVRNSAIVSTTGDDPENPPQPPLINRTENNNALIDTPLSVAPLLVSNKTAAIEDANGNGVADPGEVITYTITLQNNGDAPATDVSVTDTIPANTTYVPNSSTLNGTALADVAGTTPFADGELVNSPGQPVGSGIVNPGANGVATAQLRVRINNPLSEGVTQIENTASVTVPGQPVITTQPPTVVPITPPDPRLRLVKRITNAIRGNTPISGVNFNSPLTDTPDAIAINNALAAVGIPFQGVSTIGSNTTLQSGDIVEYTIYFLSDGGQPANNIRICDAVPTGTTYVPDTFAPGNGILLNQGGTQTPQTNASDTDRGTFFSTLSPVTSPCADTNNPNGSVFLQLGNVPNTAPTNTGFVRFRVKID